MRESEFICIQNTNTCFLHKEEEVFVGRVRSEGKLSGGSVLLEGTMESSSGHILALDLSQVEEYFIFPGQVGNMTK